MLTDPILPTDKFPYQRNILAELRAVLPPPSEDSPEARDIRDRLAMDVIRGLQPKTLDEVTVAFNYVVLYAQANHCLRLAARTTTAPADQRRCRAMAVSLSREADQWLRILSPRPKRSRKKNR